MDIIKKIRSSAGVPMTFHKKRGKILTKKRKDFQMLKNEEKDWRTRGVADITLIRNGKSGTKRLGFFDTFSLNDYDKPVWCGHNDQQTTKWSLPVKAPLETLYTHICKCSFLPPILKSSLTFNSVSYLAFGQHLGQM